MSKTTLTSPYRSLRNIVGPLKKSFSCSRLWAYSCKLLGSRLESVLLWRSSYIKGFQLLLLSRRLTSELDEERYPVNGGNLRLEDVSGGPEEVVIAWGILGLCPVAASTV